jgi:dTDP-4-dehydrorhamnose 3,5-epimerase
LIVRATKLAGVMLIELESLRDERGVFTRTFDRETFIAHGIDPCVAQCSTSLNPRPGTLRGMHYQANPHGEGKLVRCARGRVFDVALDLRLESATHRQWLGIELSAGDGRSLFIPEGCAHGFQTLEPDSEIHYQMTVAHRPDAYRGVRWDDPAFAIGWPDPIGGERIISERDRQLADYTF